MWDGFLLIKYFTERNFGLLKAKHFFHWNVSRKPKKQINWNLMLRYTVKLTLNYYFMKYSKRKIWQCILPFRYNSVHIVDVSLRHLRFGFMTFYVADMDLLNNMQNRPVLSWCVCRKWLKSYMTFLYYIII